MSKSATKPKARKRPLLWIVFILGGIATLGIAFFVGSNIWVQASTSRYVAQSVSDVPDADVAIVLGTSKRVEGADNPHFKHRMEAAAALYSNNKVRTVLVSGFHDGPYYNEPKDMRKALEDLDVPPSAIAEDGSGLRTLDSIARANLQFPYKKFVVVSDGFHVPRAVFIGRSYGLDISAYASRDVDYSYSTGSRVRECLARVKAVLDLYVLGTKPDGLDEVTPLTADTP